MHSKKRGQATLFIILGIIIVSLIAAAAYFKGDVLKQRLLSVTKATTMPENVQLLEDGLRSCYLSTAQQGVMLLGEQGGYIFPPKDSLQMENSIISYAYDQKPTVPTMQMMAQELQGYMDLMLPLCADYQSYLAEFQIEEGEPKTTVGIANNKVNLQTTYSVAIKSGNDTYNVPQPLTTTLNIRLNKMQGVAQAIASKVAQNPDAIDPEYLMTLGMPIDIIPYDKDTSIYLVHDPESNLPQESKPFTYVFATKK